MERLLDEQLHDAVEEKDKDWKLLSRAQPVDNPFLEEKLQGDKMTHPDQLISAQLELDPPRPAQPISSSSKLNELNSKKMTTRLVDHEHKSINGPCQGVNDHLSQGRNHIEHAAPILDHHHLAFKKARHHELTGRG